MMRLPQKAKCELPQSATLIYSAEAGIQGTVWPYNAPEGDGGSVFKYLIYVWYGIWEPRHINYLSTRMRGWIRLLSSIKTSASRLKR